jgi:hypothetical protein
MAASANYWKVETEQPSPGGGSHITVLKWGNKYCNDKCCNNREVATGWALQQTQDSKNIPIKVQECKIYEKYMTESE